MLKIREGPAPEGFCILGQLRNALDCYMLEKLSLVVGDFGNSIYDEPTQAMN